MTRRTFTIRSLALSVAGLFGTRAVAKAKTAPAVPTKSTGITHSAEIVDGDNGYPAFQLVVPFQDRYVVSNQYLGAYMFTTDKGVDLYGQSTEFYGLDPSFKRALILIRMSPVDWRNS